MTERRVQNNLGFEEMEREMLSELGPQQNMPKYAGIEFLPQTVYRRSFDDGPWNVADVGDVN